MVDGLLELPDGLWSEWRGPQDNQVRRDVSGGLSMMLAPSESGRGRSGLCDGSGGTSAKVHLRSQFETAWASYCDERVRPSETAKSNTHAELEASGLPSGLTVFSPANPSD